jgi:uncharacterized protein YndB with AHSA1/START domain
MAIAPGLRRDVHLPVGADAVWTAITDPDELTRWFGASVEWDLRPGGPASFRQPGGDREGRVEGVEPGRRLQFLWWPAGDQTQTSEVTYELQPDDDGTRLTVTERRMLAPNQPGEPDRAAGPAASIATSPVAQASIALGAGPWVWGVVDEAMLTVWASSQAIAVG